MTFHFNSISWTGVIANKQCDKSSDVRTDRQSVRRADGQTDRQTTEKWSLSVTSAYSRWHKIVLWHNYITCYSCLLRSCGGKVRSWLPITAFYQHDSSLVYYYSVTKCRGLAEDEKRNDRLCHYYRTELRKIVLLALKGTKTEWRKCGVIPPEDGL